MVVVLSEDWGRAVFRWNFPMNSNVLVRMNVLVASGKIRVLTKHKNEGISWEQHHDGHTSDESSSSREMRCLEEVAASRSAVQIVDSRSSSAWSAPRSHSYVLNHRSFSRSSRSPSSPCPVDPHLSSSLPSCINLGKKNINLPVLYFSTDSTAAVRRGPTIFGFQHDDRTAHIFSTL